MKLACELVAPFAVNSAVDGGQLVQPMRRHTRTCLKCQARRAAMRRTSRAMAAIADETSPAPAGLDWRVMTSLDDTRAEPGGVNKPVALVAGVVSMAAALIIWRLRPSPSG